MTQSKQKIDCTKQPALSLVCIYYLVRLCWENAGQPLCRLSLLAEKHSGDHYQPAWRSEEAVYGGMERLQRMSLEKEFLMINYNCNFKIIVVELVASEHDRLIKNPTSEVTGEKRESS